MQQKKKILSDISLSYPGFFGLEYLPRKTKTGHRPR